MAMSGRINGTVSLNSAYFSFYIDWDVINTQEDRIANNRSQVRARVYLQTTSTGRTFDTVAIRNHWVRIDGVEDAWSARINHNPWPSNPALLRTYTRYVAHNTDGTKSLNISSYVNGLASSWGPNDCNASATVTLDTIPRVSTVSLSNFTLNNGATTIYYTVTPQSSAFNHDMELRIGATTIATWNIAAGVSGNLSRALSEAERLIIFNAMSTTTSSTVTLRLQTKSGTTLVGTVQTNNATCTINSNVRPTISSLAKVESTATMSVWTQVGAHVQRLSRITFTITGAAAGIGASLSSYSISFDGSTYSAVSATTPIITKSGNLTASATATDSRGRVSVAATVVVNFLVYNVPNITSVSIARCNSDGSDNQMGTSVRVITAGDVGSLVNTTERNTITYNVYARLRGTTPWGTVLRTLGPNATPISSGRITISDNHILSTFAAENSYDFRIEISDAFSTQISLPVLSVGQVTMSWGKAGIAVGKVWEAGALDVLGNVIVDGHVDTDRFYTLLSYANQLTGNARSWNIHIPASVGTPNPQLAWTNDNGELTTYQLNHAHSYAASVHTHSLLTAGNGLVGTAYNGGTAYTWVLGTPGSCGPATLNAVTASSHTHALTGLGGFTRTSILARTAVASSTNYNLGSAITNFDLILIRFSPWYSSTTYNSSVTMILDPGDTNVVGTQIYYSPPFWIGTLRAIEIVFNTTSQVRVVALSGSSAPRMNIVGLKFAA